MSFRTLVITYILGGLTFVPLLLLAILIPGWYLSPKIAKPGNVNTRDGGALSGNENEKDSDTSLEDRRRAESLTGETAASGTFAVLRKYDLQAAVSALNARNAASGNTVPGADVAEHDASSAGSESVYQSMYRSVFDWSKNASSTASLLHREDQNQDLKNARKKSAPANVLYILLRHGHLMIYDSPAQVEVKHVISLAHHSVSLQAGVGVEEEEDFRQIPEPDLFIKRTAIVLRPLGNIPSSQTSASHSPKPFYLFSANCSEKEEFYHALLATRAKPPLPRPLDTDALIKLQSALHSSLLTSETRALNALIGRVFLAVHKGENITAFVRGKIEKKLARIQKPSFIPVLNIQSLDMGDAGPVFSNPRLRDLNINGDMTVSADVRYTGGLSITLLAVAKLDLGPRFKTRTVDLMLKTSIQRISGTMLVRIKPPPSNRIWFTFDTMPDMEIRVEPVVSERKITYGFILRAIEERIRTAIGEGLVKPNWDDIPLPLSDTRGSHARGGLWIDEGEDDSLQSQLGSSKRPEMKHQRTASLPTLIDRSDTASEHLGLSSGPEFDIPRLRSSATMPVEDHGAKHRSTASSIRSSISAAESASSGTVRRKPVRSPSLTSPSSPAPVVAVDEQHVEPVRSDDASIRSQQSRSLWRGRGSLTAQGFQKDALEELREIRNQAEVTAAKYAARFNGDGDSRHGGSSDDQDHQDNMSEGQSDRDRQLSDGSISRGTATPKTEGFGRTDSSISSLSFSTRSLPGQQTPAKKTTLLAATATAANAAKTWGWNTIQKNKTAFQNARTRQDQPEGEPYGRGQPLPPPGVPLPGPQKPLWTGMGSMRKKPVPALPPRPPRGEKMSSTHSQGDLLGTSPKDNAPLSHSPSSQVEDDEFGPWRQNSGPTLAEDEHSQHSGDRTDRADESDEHAKREGMPSSTASDLDDSVPTASETTAEELPAVSQHAEEKTAAVTKKVPPPLPARRKVPETLKPRSELDDDTPTSLEKASTSVKDIEDSATDDSETQALPIPAEVAEAIAEENFTESQAKGLDENEGEIDTSAGDLVEIGEHENKLEHGLSGAHDGDDDIPTTPSAHLAEDKFVRGEKLGEDDFVEDTEAPSATTSGPSNVALAAASLASSSAKGHR